MPELIAAIACSRTPKWRLRPRVAPFAADRPLAVGDLRSPGSGSRPAPLSAVSVEGLRSAEPPMSSGTRAAIALMTFPPAERVASGLSAVVKVGMSASQPFGSSPAITRSNSAARSGWALR